MAWYNDPKTVSAYAGLVASIAALIVSVSALRRKPDNTDSKGMYKVLVEAVERLSDESEQNRADIFRIRKYMDEYVKAQSQNSISFAPPQINPPAQIVQVDPPRIIVSNSNIDAGINQVPIAVASSSSSVDHANINLKPSPPIKLDREWKTKK